VKKGDTNIMIDIETLGTKPGSVIVAIGAMAFDPFTSQIGERFYLDIDAHDAQKRGLTIDVGTFFFWLGQTEEAKGVLLRTKRVPLDQALHSLTQWLQGQQSRCSNSTQWLWANSPDFDLVLLEAAYRTIGLEAPWTHRNRMDLRTLIQLTGASALKSPLSVQHHALWDAHNQIEVVFDGFRKLGKQAPNVTGFQLTPGELPEQGQYE